MRLRGGFACLFVPGGLVLVGLLGCASENDPGGGALGGCWECRGVEERPANYAYDITDLEYVAGTWRGYYPHEDEFGPLDIEVDVDLGQGALFGVLHLPEGCEVSDSWLEESGKCKAVTVRDAATATSERADSMQDDRDLEVSGEELSCPQPAPDSSAGCPRIEFEAILNDNEASFSLVLAEDGRLWVSFTGCRLEGDVITDYEPIGEKVE